jgi:hypothetical protein
MANSREMSPRPPAASILLAAIAAAVTIGGCGSGGTNTVSVSGAPTAGTAAHRTNTARTTPSPSPSSTTSTQTSTGGAEATRTSTAPAFTKEAKPSAGELSDALSVVKAHGYTANDSSDYHSDQTLRVLIGTRSGSGDGYGQHAFFFLGGHYLGTDTSEASAQVKVVSQGDTEVTLAYPLYKPHDPLCCASGGQTTVRFQLNDGRLVPLDAIPPAHSSSGPSRQ